MYFFRINRIVNIVQIRPSGANSIRFDHRLEWAQFGLSLVCVGGESSLTQPKIQNLAQPSPPVGPAHSMGGLEPARISQANFFFFTFLGLGGPGLA